MKDPLPVPDQLERQLSKCKTVRDADTYCVSRMKTAEVSRKERERENNLFLCCATAAAAEELENTISFGYG